jgi:uncharacterized protein (TIGR02646 family)
MIQITRCKPPQVLKGSPRKGSYYNTPSVVKSLWEMQYEKCCYCEQKIPEDGHAKAVEHFQPKSVFKNRQNDWQNLLLACSQCNGKKSDRFPVELTDDSGQPKVVYLKRGARGKALIIDPSDSRLDPEEHIDFVVDDGDPELGRAVARNNSRSGSTTIDVVGLRNPHYVRERKSFFKLLNHCYMLLLEAENQRESEMLEFCKKGFAMLVSAKGKFAGFARAYARTKERKLRDLGLKIPKGAELADSAFR